MTKLKIKKDDEEITLVDEKDIENSLDEKADNSDLDDYIQKSSTAGLVKNDGSIDTAEKVNKFQGSTNANKNVVTNASGNIITEAKPTIPTKTSDLTNDSNYTTATGHNHDGTYIKTGTGTVTSTNIADETIVDGDIAVGTISSNKLEKSTIWWASTGYTKILQIKHTSNSNWANIPISFEIEKRGQNTAIQCHLMFTGTSTSDPILEEGNFRIDANANIYAYKESTGTWSIIVYAVNNDVQTIRNLRVGDYNYQTNGHLMDFTYLNEKNVTLPTDTTTNPLIKATPLIADNLTTDDGTRALSAKQGKTLKTLVDGHNHDSTYIKKTGGVSQHSNGNIIIPSDADSTNVDATGYIPFGHTIQDTTKTLREILPTKKSVIGAVISKGTTGNQYDYVISARHRNGSYDGYKYGMYIRAGWSTNGNLAWAESNNGDYGTEKTILDSSNYSAYANKTTVTDNLTTDSSTNALSAKQGKILNDRYKGITLASSGTNTAKPYYRLFHIESGSGTSKSSRLIFEISSKTSTAYAKFAVYMRQNTSSSASTIDFQCLEKVGVDLNTISVGFRNNYPNTSCDIYINVQSMVHYIIKVIDDQLREGTYTQYSPTEGNIEAYTSIANAGTQLYGSAYTSVINPTWDSVTATITYTDGSTSTINFVTR